MQRARLILDAPASGTWNMAVDEALLRSAAERTDVTLRIYRWEQPTLSLGYFQSHQRRAEHAASRNCPLVRRCTGGGAIIHDQEVTYSLTAPVANRWDRRIEQWYGAVHESWIESLAECGVTARRCGVTDPERESEFLCFQRRAQGDLLLDRSKVGGSAQRRQRHAALQHGSLLTGQSSAAPELLGIEQITGVRLDETNWLNLWLAALSRRLEVAWEPGNLDDRERTWSRELETDKFGSGAWTLRR